MSTGDNGKRDGHLHVSWARGPRPPRGLAGEVTDVSARTSRAEPTLPVQGETDFEDWQDESCDCDCLPGAHWCILCPLHGALSRELRGLR